MRRFILFCAIAAAAVPGCRSGGEKKTEEAGGREAMAASPYGKPGFTALPAADNRIWVFRTGSEELAEFEKSGEPVKFVTRPGAGPGGMTVRAPDGETILEYAAAREGFVTFVRKNRIWVFRPGTKDLAEFETSGEPAKCCTRIGAGPLGMTVKGSDTGTIDAYLAEMAPPPMPAAPMTDAAPAAAEVTMYDREGFVAELDKSGRLWVFREDAKELEEFRKQGELGKHVTRIGAGPGGITIKGPDTATILEYVAASDGFATYIRDERIWVFRPDSKELEEFLKSGEPAKCTTRIGAGPLGMTVKGADAGTIDAYLAAVSP